MHAISHVTGGGLAANLARVLPVDVAVDLDQSARVHQCRMQRRRGVVDILRIFRPGVQAVVGDYDGDPLAGEADDAVRHVRAGGSEQLQLKATVLAVLDEVKPGRNLKTNVEFYTALFPKDGTYYLPLRKDLREKLKIELGDRVKVTANF